MPAEPSEVDPSGADPSGADPSGADPSGADLSGVEGRGAVFAGVDLTGATFRECDLTGVRIVGSVIDDLSVTAFSGRLGTVVVEGVDVTEFVAAELDRRHPERVQLRAVRTADDHRAMWATIERLWDATLAGVEDGPLVHQRVDGEWSLAETLRHLVFAVDVWRGRMILGLEAPHHPLGLPTTDLPDAEAAELGVDLAARPSYAEVLAAFADRRGQVSELLGSVTDADLAGMRTAVPAPSWGEATRSVGRCLRVILDEHCEHHRYATRDLARL